VIAEPVQGFACMGRMPSLVELEAKKMSWFAARIVFTWEVRSAVLAASQATSAIAL
jgi:hypothetical protein